MYTNEWIIFIEDHYISLYVLAFIVVGGFTLGRIK